MPEKSMNKHIVGMFALNLAFMAITVSPGMPSWLVRGSGYFAGVTIGLILAWTLEKYRSPDAKVDPA
jgi:hypothetical protein